MTCQGEDGLYVVLTLTGRSGGPDWATVARQPVHGVQLGRRQPAQLVVVLQGQRVAPTSAKLVRTSVDECEGVA